MKLSRAEAKAFGADLQAQGNDAPLLKIENLQKSFGGVRALDGVSFSIEAGQCLALIGPNGAGKSTCFNIVNGQLKPDVGRVYLQGENIAGLAPRKIFRRGVGRTFQIAAVFPSLSVIENIQTALISQARRTFDFFTDSTKQRRENALARLEQVGMADRAEQTCATLAYGDVKRLELAIALSSDPKLLLMDEPTAGMAPKERHELMALTRKLVEDRGVTIMFTEHVMEAVFDYAQEIVVFARGKLIAKGSGAMIRAHAGVRETYLGRDFAPMTPP